MSEELEWKTRRDRIDRRLKSLRPPWTIVKYRASRDPSELQRHAVDELIQSILAKALRGEPAPQDPNDEPASELLKRIREERRKQDAERGPGRRGPRRGGKTISRTL